MELGVEGMCALELPIDMKEGVWGKGIETLTVARVPAEVETSREQ